MNDMAAPVTASYSENASSAPWWTRAVTYQVYPRSFFDANGDGNGDLKGIEQKIPYLKYLGVNAIWINPFFKSPKKDQGYDAESYHKVDGMFGTNADLKSLIDTAHTNNIKVVLDLVINHTSDQHPWFRRALKPDMVKRRQESRYDAKKDKAANVYVFRPVDPASPDTPPNNWKNFVGDKPAWTKVGNEWYLHKFDPAQPDLDNRNELVRKHIGRILQRWVGDQKIDGIRMDVLDHTFHDPTFKDFERHLTPVGTGYLDPFHWQKSWILASEAQVMASEMSQAIRSANPDAVSISELFYGPLVADFKHCCDFNIKGKIDLPFNFSLLDTVNTHGANATEFKKIVEKYLRALPDEACPNFVMSNHDQVMRLVDKVGEPNIRAVTMMLLSLGNHNGSNVFMYNGDELGMHRGSIINESNMDDPIGKAQGLEKSRDHVRTGFVWSAHDVNGGYSASEKPWLPGGATIDGRGVVEQIQDPNSQLNFTKDMIALRQQESALGYGRYIAHETNDKDMYCFERDAGHQRVLMAFNFSDYSKTITLPQGQILLSTVNAKTGVPVRGELVMSPHEGCVVQVRPSL